MAADCKGFMDSLKFPPGRRFFHPTDEELITHYLWRKIGNGSFSTTAICEADLRRLDPWDFPGVSVPQGERRIREWFFFSPSPRDWIQGIYRATYSGYWKTTGKDIQIFKGKALIGTKRSMVFYKGRIPKITKTNWFMHEYRLESNNNNEWVICKVFLENKVVEISAKEELKPPSNSINTTQAITAPLFVIKLKYKKNTVKFVLNNPTFDGLKTQVLERFNNLETDALEFKYRHLDGTMISIVCHADLQCCLGRYKLAEVFEVKMSVAS